MSGGAAQVSWYSKVGATTLSVPPGATPRLHAACRDPPQKADVSALSPLPEQEGGSFNLNNCYQGFSGDSLVSETGSLVSRGLSGEHPPPPSVAKASPRWDFLHLLLLVPLAFCFPKHSPRVGRGPRCSAGADRVSVHPKRALFFQGGRAPASLLFVLAEAVLLDHRPPRGSARTASSPGCHLHPEVPARHISAGLPSARWAPGGGVNLGW